MKQYYIFLLGFLNVVIAIPNLPSKTDTRPRRVDLRAVTTTAAPPLDNALCGWLGGDPGSPWTCAISGTCVIDPNPTINAIGCCPSAGCAPFRTACIPASQACGSACLSNSANLICSSTANPLCATFTYPGNYTELRCTSSIPSQLHVAFTFSAFPTPLPLPRLVTTLTSCDSTDRCLPGLQIKTQTPNPASTTGKTSALSTSPAPKSTSTSVSPSGGSSSHTRAIVGGVVGGIAVIAIAAVAIFFLYFRQKRGVRDRSHPVPQNSATPESDKYYSSGPGPGEELAEIRNNSKRGFENPAVPVVSEMDVTEQQQRPLMELEANERELRPLRPPGDNMPQRVEL